MNPTETNDEQRIARLIEGAEAGDAESQFQLARAYEQGDAIEQDARLAALWFKRAAQQDHIEGIANYADSLYYGRGVNKDLNKAFTHYLKGANAGHLLCMYNVGYSYLWGEGVEKDPDLGFYWYKRAADLGNKEAQTGLGWLYQFGDAPVEKNLQTAADWFRKAAAQNHGQAMSALGKLYLQKDDDEYEYDPLEALYWFKKGAQLNCPKCQYQLGRLLAWDEDMKANFPEAIQWLRKAACQGESDAYQTLSLVLLWNKEDPEEIFYWISRYCLYENEDQNPPALIADCFHRTAAVKDHPDTWSLAIYWWKLATELGCSYSQEEMQKCIEYGGTLERAHQILDERQICDKDYVSGMWMIPLDLSESIWWENLPIPRMVQIELGQQPVDDLPAQRTENMRRTPEEMAEQQSSATVLQQDINYYHTGTVLQPKEAAPPPQQQQQVQSNSGDMMMPFITDSTQLPPGSIFAEKYFIEKVLGRGGMAVVFKAKHLLMNRAVAIKMMLPEVAKDKVTAQRFQREAQNASVLRHPNVITIYDFGVTYEGQPFMVMDYLQGESLETILERERFLLPSRGVEILVQMCDALQAAHHAGIVHRDIKPSNIMVEQMRGKDHVKLVDFGIAKSLGDQDEQQMKLTKTGEVFGSLVYMSPEQCMGKPLDHRSDIYSFGCVIFEMFCAEPPFIGDTVFETMSKHIYEDPPPMRFHPDIKPTICADIEHLFRKCVEKDPKHRFQSMDEIKEALRSLH